MPHRHPLPNIPATRAPVSLLTVERAVFELRAGRAVAVGGADGSRALVMAAEGAGEQNVRDFTQRAGCDPVLAITQRRADVLGLHLPADQTDAGVLTLSAPGGLSTAEVLHLADPLSPTAPTDLSHLKVSAVPRHGPHSAAVGLTKIARLLPAALVADLCAPNSADLAGWAARHDIVRVDGGDVFQYEHTAARMLKRVSQARVPLENAENTRIIAYRPKDGGLEHLAIVIGDPKADNVPLVRIHSECFTGDLLGSLRCDCGDQLRGAIAVMGAAGSGVLLYLAQEGRGIGLVNKLRAYTLQDQGLDTLDANEMLGYDADERVYLPAAEILKDLNLKRINLLTNNPDKVHALTHFGIDVAERVAHTFPSNKHNELYLDTKKHKGGHLF